jgi:hypothetical protein
MKNSKEKQNRVRGFVVQGMDFLKSMVRGGPSGNFE